jgi:hypothetical protein
MLHTWDKNELERVHRRAGCMLVVAFESRRGVGITNREEHHFSLVTMIFRLMKVMALVPCVYVYSFSRYSVG